MKKQFLTEVRVGLFVLFGLVVMTTLVFMLGSEGRLFERHYKLLARFNDISGLRIGAPVQLAGLDVGMVEGIRFEKSLQERQITIVLRINKNYEDRIRADSVTTVNTQGLLGDKYIFISVGSETEPILKNGDYVKSEETTPIFALAEKAGKIMDDIGEVSQDIKQMFKTVEGEKGGDLRATLKSVRTTLEQVENGPGLAHALIYDPKGKEVVANLDRALSGIGDLTGEAGKKKATKGMIANLQQASGDLKDILAGIRRGEGTLGMLVRDPELYNELRTFLGKANRSKLVKSVIRATLEENDKQIISSE